MKQWFRRAICMTLVVLTTVACGTKGPAGGSASPKKPSPAIFREVRADLAGFLLIPPTALRIDKLRVRGAHALAVFSFQDPQGRSRTGFGALSFVRERWRPGDMRFDFWNKPAERNGLKIVLIKFGSELAMGGYVEPKVTAVVAQGPDGRESSDTPENGASALPVVLGSQVRLLAGDKILAAAPVTSVKKAFGDSTPDSRARRVAEKAVDLVGGPHWKSAARLILGRSRPLEMASLLHSLLTRLEASARGPAQPIPYGFTFQVSGPTAGRLDILVTDLGHEPKVWSYAYSSVEGT